MQYTPGAASRRLLPWMPTTHITMTASASYLAVRLQQLMGSALCQAAWLQTLSFFLQAVH